MKKNCSTKLHSQSSSMIGTSSLPSLLSLPSIESIRHPEIDVEPSFTVTSIKCRPFDRSSRLYLEKPGKEHFFDRRDHLLFRNQLGIAVLISLSRRDYTDMRSVRAVMNVSLVDVDADSTIWFGTVQQRIRTNGSNGFARIDIPLPYLHTIPSHDYRIIVEDSQTGKTMGQTDLRFYDLPVIHLLPTKWHEAYWGEVRPDELYEEVKIEWGFFNMVDINTNRLPEIEITVYLPNGKILSAIKKPEKEPASPFRIKAEAWFCREDMPDEGIGYAEAKCMGHAFAGFLFDCEKLDDIQIADEDQLSVFRNYTPEKAKEEYARLHPDLRKSCAEDRKKEEKSAIVELDDEDIAQMLEEFIASNSVESIPDNDPEEANVTESISENDSEEAAVRNSPAVEEEPSGMSLLDKLTGLTSVKKKVKDYTDFARFTQIRNAAGLPVVTPPLHCLFMGSPGTGKTTVGKIMGKLLKEAGILSSGHVVVKERATLLGQNYNSESEKTLEALKEAEGGILFIDEAYQLYQPEDPRDPGKFVLETLMTALADESRRDWMLILAGYSKPMLKMLNLNPGLHSRIPESNYYYFEDFQPKDLMEIAVRYLTDHQFLLSEKAEIALRDVISRDFDNRPAEFGNGRYVMNLIQTAILPAAASRIIRIENPSIHDLSTIMPSDIPEPTYSHCSARTTIGFRA